MYYIDRFGLPYIGMGIEISIPMYRLLKLGSPYIGKALNGSISDVYSKNHTFQIHRDSAKISDSDVSPKRIHRNSIKIGNPDVS